MKYSLTNDARAILLLCAFQGGEEEFRPLGGAEYNRVATVLYRSGKWPRDLLEAQSLPEIAGVSSDRLRWLLGRRINLGFCLEEWQRKGYWVFARSDSDYPKAIRASMRNDAPPLLFGTGDQSLLASEGLAIFGPDAIPEGRIRKACDVAADAAKQGQTVVVAGHLKMARKIVEAVQECLGRVIWVLHDGELKQRLKKAHRQAISSDQLVMVTAQSPKASKESGETAMVSSLAAGFAEEILYVDGSNSKLRKDRFKTTGTALRRLSDCWLLHGRPTTPEGQELKEKGIRVWKTK
ncbi:MAG: DNA-processing protein DprA [Bacteroidetes bacterium]|nr:DNA-processing protein DprA [Bacteroidota bacterium]